MKQFGKPRRKSVSDIERQSRADRIKWLKELRAAIPKTSDQITTRTLEIWSVRLLKIPMPILVVAANILAERLTFFPSLAEILAVCREVENRADNRKWKANLEKWAQESLPPGEAKKMLTEVLSAASEKKGTELVLVRGLKRILSEPVKTREVGGNMTDEEWEDRKVRQKGS
jgi:hypothetical protein